jgi:hypothetical protein
LRALTSLTQAWRYLAVLGSILFLTTVKGVEAGLSKTGEFLVIRHLNDYILKRNTDKQL